MTLNVTGNRDKMKWTRWRFEHEAKDFGVLNTTFWDWGQGRSNWENYGHFGVLILLNKMSL
jgi:hypothetical protein